ncbi:ribonuclease 2-like [Salvia miltiorrhiza]|uniref:ribonuclease 2-like n=1 Tax=Salvia miltiorrhiza TaxID=226208 RepID=UPI0025AC9EAC|nr:ribonuclease 2-like [Salvia miltiorrhiza]
MVSLLARRIDLQKIQCIIFAIFWIGSSCAAEMSASSDLGELSVRSGNQQREFDYFMLSFLWPGTACLSSGGECCHSNACCRRSSALTEFTIHGLWPDYNDGTWPACCPGKRFDIKKISTLLSTMNKYWPSYSCESSSNCHGGTGLFWEHEWEKHGPCSFPIIRDEYDYFMTVLNLYFKYNVTEILGEAGYVASNSEKYPLGGMVSAIENAFHATPALVCSGDAVEELRLCFCKDFKFRDCAVETSCPKYVSLPEFISSGLENKEAEALKLET